MPPIQPSKGRQACTSSPTTAHAAHAGAAAAACPDFQPPGNYTCADQSRFGKCGAPWMVAGGFCQQTCRRCPTGAAAAPAEEQLRATLATQNLVLTTLRLPGAPAPAGERPAPAAERPAAAAARPAPPQRRPPPAAERPVQPQRRPVQSPIAETPQVLPAVAFLPPVAEPTAAGGLPAVPFLLVPPAAETTPQATPQAQPGCNPRKTAWAVLSADPDLSTTRQAVQALNLTAVLHSPNIKFTVSSFFSVFLSPTLHAAPKPASLTQPRPPVPHVRSCLPPPTRRGPPPRGRRARPRWPPPPPPATSSSPTSCPTGR